MKFEFSIDVSPSELAEFLGKLGSESATGFDKTSIERVGEKVSAVLKRAEGDSHAISEKTS